MDVQCRAKEIMVVPFRQCRETVDVSRAILQGRIAERQVERMEMQERITDARALRGGADPWDC